MGSKATTYRATLPDGKEVTVKTYLTIEGKAYCGAWYYREEWRPGAVTGKVVEVDGTLRPIYGYGSEPVADQVAVEAFPVA